MDWQSFYDHIDKGEISRIYLFSGEEEYIKDAAVRHLREKLLPPGLESMNESVLTDPSVDKLTETCETLPFMSDKRLVIVKEFGMLVNPGQGKAADQEVERLTDWMLTSPDETCLVFIVRGEGKQSGKLFSEIAKRYDNIKFDLLEDGQLIKWLNSALKPDKKRIDTAAVHELVFMAGRTLTRLSSELEKLRAYSADRTVITTEDVRAVVTPSTESNVFKLVDAVIDKDMKTAAGLTRMLLENGESAVGIIAMLTRQVRFMAYMKLMSENGDTFASIERALKMNHYGAIRTEKQVRRYSSCVLMEAYRKCVDADYAVKNGKMADKEALDLLVFTLAGMKKEH